jgi:SAM-dependent methyltransferase
MTRRDHDDDPFSRCDYRRLIAWPERIRREAPLLAEVFSAASPRRLLDLGCGTGEHARFLHAQGFEVVGIDRSPAMLQKAREEPLPSGLEFREGDMSRLEDAVGGSFGGALCLGNALPHLTEAEEMKGFARGLRGFLDPGGLLLLQILNYERIFGRGIRHLPISFRPGEEDDDEVVFLRLMELRDDGRLVFVPSTLRLRSKAESPLELVRSRRVELKGWTAPELESMLSEAGFQKFRRYGGFDRSPYETLESADLVLVAS